MSPSRNLPKGQMEIPDVGRHARDTALLLANSAAEEVAIPGFQPALYPRMLHSRAESSGAIFGFKDRSWRASTGSLVVTLETFADENAQRDHSGRVRRARTQPACGAFGTQSRPEEAAWGGTVSRSGASPRPHEEKEDSLRHPPNWSTRTTSIMERCSNAGAGHFWTPARPIRSSGIAR